MKSFTNKIFQICFLVFLFKGSICFSQRGTFFSGITDSVLVLYKNDADRLALRQALSGKSTYKDSINIDKKLSQYYLKVLMAVYNAKDFPARDTVVKHLNIHSYNPGMTSIVLRGVSNLVWMSNLKNNHFPTGNSTLDFLMRRYGLEKTFYSSLFQPNLVVLSSKSNYNLEALSCSLESVHGASGIQPEFLYGDGNDISDSLIGKDLEISYSYGWDNCRTGCRSRRLWKFKVKEDFSVVYLGSWGQSLEPGLEMYISGGAEYFKNLNLYPNPVKDKLYVEIDSAKQLELKLSIVNQKGDVVFTHTNLESGEILNLGHLLMGFYSLILENGSQKKVYSLKKNFNPE
ncbi:MAG: T9SS type A sorting domain-containing protein [Bacteroidia bacterium]|nr:T9SS type A sorting domain-containing protein [Bacteroidia bacterium]